MAYFKSFFSKNHFKHQAMTIFFENEAMTFLITQKEVAYHCKILQACLCLGFQPMSHCEVLGPVVIMIPEGAPEIISFVALPTFLFTTMFACN